MSVKSWFLPHLNLLDIHKQLSRINHVNIYYLINSHFIWRCPWCIFMFKHFEPPLSEILDTQGSNVRKYSESCEKGIAKLTWVISRHWQSNKNWRHRLRFNQIHLKSIYPTWSDKFRLNEGDKFGRYFTCQYWNDILLICI